MSLYREALAVSPTSPDVLFGLGVVEAQRGRLSIAYDILNSAIRELEQAASEPSLIATADARAGLVAYEMCDIELATAHWHKSVKLELNEEVKSWLLDVQPMAAHKVSVLLYASNQAHFLRQTVASIFCQTHKNIELIIIHDGSSDNTQQVLNELSQNYRFERVMTSVKVGIEASLGTAASMASGTFSLALNAVDFLDSDLISNELKTPKPEHQLEKNARFARWRNIRLQ